MRPKKDLTKGAILPHILKMAIPMMIGVTAHMILNLADGMYVSHLGSEATQAVLNYGFPMFYVIFAIFNGLNAGAAAILAQLLGAKEGDKAQNTFAQVMLVSLGIFAVFFMFFPLLTDWYLAFMGAPEHIAALTREYLDIVVYGLFLTAMGLILGGALRAEGNMRAQMNAMMVGTLANLILDPFLIFENFSFLSIEWTGAGWGVEGAAAATVISNGITFFMLLAIFLRKKSSFSWPALPHWKDTSGLKKIFGVGTPAMISQSMTGLSLTLLTFLMTPFGEDAITGLGIGIRLDIIAVFPALSVMTAVVALTGQNYGAGQIDRVKETIYKGLILSFVSLVIIGGLVYLLKGSLVGLFSPTTQVAQEAVHYVACLSLSYGFIALSMVSGGAFQGLGKGLPSMYITVFRALVVNGSLAWLLSREMEFGSNGIHYAPMLSNMLMGTVAMLWLLWTVKKLPTQK